MPIQSYLLVWYATKCLYQFGIRQKIWETILDAWITISRALLTLFINVDIWNYHMDA